MTDQSPETAYHYAVIRRALDVIDSAETPLSLEELSRRMQMSPAHFQRIFSQWVGVSPEALPAIPRARPRAAAAARAVHHARHRGTSRPVRHRAAA
jgi:methylphosphotriester-DNA--protein-cysteine methyltransferase